MGYIKTAFLILGLGLFLPAVYAVEAAPSPETSVAAPLEKINRLEKEGHYLDAQKAYESLLREKGLDKKTTREVMKKYETLNLKLLFSRQEMPGSVQHTIKPGDRLQKLAKQYKTTIELIGKSNELKGDKIIAGKKLKIVNGTFSIRVDKSRNRLFLFLDQKLFKTYRIATGAQDGTPAGEFTITHKVENPAWYKPGKVIRGGAKENELGTRWLGFDNPGYGIHGTPHPESIGQHVTSGCIRMLNKDVEELYLIIPTRTKVKVMD